MATMSAIGEGILDNPYDLCIFPGPNGEPTLAVTDNAKGLVLFSLNGQTLGRIEGAAEAGGIDFDSASNQLAVTSARQPTGLPVYVQLYSVPENLKLIREVEIPDNPSIKSGYVRWIAYDKIADAFFLAFGDSAQACLYKLSKPNYSWKLICIFEGDLGHLTVLPPGQSDSSTQLLITEWTEKNEWAVKIWQIVGDKIAGEKVVTRSSANILEPWSCAADENLIAVYDYRTGNIFLFDLSTLQLITMIGSVGAGQWVSLVVAGKTIYASCSDERLVYTFRLAQ